MGGEGSLRAVRLWPAPDDGAVEQQLIDAALAAVGELGYSKTTLRDILQRSGRSYQRFRQHFDSKESCFAAAYEVEAERLCEGVLAAGRSADCWRQGFRAGLAHFLGFVAGRPLHAKALLIDGHAAGERPGVKHREVIGRLSKAIDSARGQVALDKAPPPMTAQLILGAVESTAVDLIIEERTEEAEEKLSELAHFAVLLFFGHEAARAELEVEP